MALKQRVLTALALIPLVIVAIVLLPPPWFALLIAAIVAPAAWEWAGLSGLQLPAARGIYMVTVLVSLLLVYLLEMQEAAGFMLYVAVAWWSIGLLLVLLYEATTMELKLVRAIRLIIGVLVLVPAWWSLVVLRGADDGGITRVLFLLVMIWVADSAAYFSGKRWGQRRLARRVSPGKSWEGVIVSLLVVVILALASTPWLLEIYEDRIMFMSVCVVTAGCSVLGDLFESLVKRTVQIKDSGSLLPGHGGVLDRIDSLTAAAPAFLIGLVLMGKV